MHLTFFAGITLPIFSLLLLLTPMSNAQRSDYAPCIETCIDENPGLSWCDGDETGDALDECTCASYSTTDPLITCMTEQCTPEEQAPFAQNLPELCRDFLLPDAADSTEGGEEETATATETESTTATSTESPTETETGTETEDGEAEETPAEETGTDGAATLGMSSYAIIGGLLVALAV